MGNRYYLFVCQKYDWNLVLNEYMNRFNGVIDYLNFFFFPLNWFLLCGWMLQICIVLSKVK